MAGCLLGKETPDPEKARIDTVTVHDTAWVTVHDTVFGSIGNPDIVVGKVVPLAPGTRWTYADTSWSTGNMAPIVTVGVHSVEIEDTAMGITIHITTGLSPQGTGGRDTVVKFPSAETLPESLDVDSSILRMPFHRSQFVPADSLARVPERGAPALLHLHARSEPYQSEESRYILGVGLVSYKFHRSCGMACHGASTSVSVLKELSRVK